MDNNRIYEYRFQNVDKKKKLITWQVIANYIFRELNAPTSIIDIAAGECEFINAVPVEEKWAVDLNSEFISKFVNKNIRVKTGNALQLNLPEEYFEAAFISNFLEHLNSHEEIHTVLTNIYQALRKDGRIAVIGPNFKYCSTEYFDFADHKIILTHISLEEHLYNAGFKIVKVFPKFLPVSFRGKLPVNKFIVKTYFTFPILWKIVGKQFLVIAKK